MENNFKDDTFLARWLNGELSADELSAFESSEDFKGYQKIIAATESLETPARDKALGWEKLNQQIKSSKQEKETVIRPLYAWLKYGVAALLIFSIGYFTFYNKSDIQTYQTAMAEQQRIELPDGSIITMNADSRIAFNESDFLDNRYLELSGEAFFEVKKGNTFTVETFGGDIRVLGTSFNVKLRNEILDLTCYSGSVGLSFDQFENIEILSPGDRVISEKKKVQEKRKMKSPNPSPGWANGNSIYENADFGEVLEDLKRQYDIQLTIKATLDNLPRYNGGFPHNDLEAALEIIFSPIGLKYEIKGSAITIYD